MRVMKKARVFEIESIMAFDGNEITDHNRQPISVSAEMFMHEERMVDGTLRRYHVATKRTWSVSWSELFSKSEFVVDGYWSGEEMRQFYDDTPGEFELTLTYGDGTTESVLVMFSEFSYDISKRTTDYDFWELNLTLVEV